jgi:hypothetical protein
LVLFEIEFGLVVIGFRRYFGTMTTLYLHSHFMCA